MIAYDSGEVDLHARVKVSSAMDGDHYGRVHTPGRIMPPGGRFREVIPFSVINRIMDKKIHRPARRYLLQAGRREGTVILSDRLKDLGFSLCHHGRHLHLHRRHDHPERKEELIDKAYEEVKVVQNQYSEGLITDGERYNKVIDIWADVTERIADELMRELGSEG